MALRAALAALVGALVYLACGIAIGRHPHWQLLAATDLPVWLLWVGLSTLPIAFAALLLVRLAARLGGVAAVAASIFAAVGSVPLFIWYMRYWSPRVAWERGWLLPLAVCVAALILYWCDWPRLRPTRAASA